MIAVLLSLLPLLGGDKLNDSVVKYLSEKDPVKAEKLFKALLAGKPPIDKLMAAAESYVPAWKSPGMSTLFFMKTDKGELSYRLLVPPNVKPGTRMPLLLALPHGDGKEPVTEEALSLYWREEGLKRGFLVLAPIAMDGSSSLAVGETGKMAELWDHGNIDHFQALLREVCTNYPVDRNRMFMAGVFQGGVAGLLAIPRMTDLFQAGIFLSAAVPSEQVTLFENLKGFPVLVGAGKEDQDFFVKGSAGVEAAINKAGGKCERKLYDGVEHELKVPGTELYGWLGAQKREPAGKEQTFYCAESKFSRSGWIEILSLEEGVDMKRPARIEVSIHEGNVIDIKTRGIKKLRFYLRHEFFDWTQPIVVIEEGKQLFRGDVSPDPVYFFKQWRSDFLRRDRYVNQIEFEIPE